MPASDKVLNGPEIVTAYRRSLRHGTWCGRLRTRSSTHSDRHGISLAADRVAAVASGLRERNLSPMTTQTAR